MTTDFNPILAGRAEYHQPYPGWGVVILILVVGGEGGVIQTDIIFVYSYNEKSPG